MLFQHVRGEYTDASLTDLPWSILDLVNLYSRVDGSFNAIKSFSNNLPLRIPHLTHLNLSYNNLTEIPSTICLLLHLQEVLLRDNKLSQLPDEIVLLRKLELLDVSHNLLQSLPKDIGKMGNLKKLNVSYNLLNAIPSSLGYSPKLKLLLASNNRCTRPRQELCDISAELIEYLRSQALPILTTAPVNKFARVRSNIARSQLSGDARSQYVQSQTRTSQPSSRTKVPLLLPVNATQLSPDILADRIIGKWALAILFSGQYSPLTCCMNFCFRRSGLIYGAALGDTLGLATEYLPSDEIEFYYSDGRLSHDAILSDEHRSHFQRGRMTCVSDLMVNKKIQ